MSSLDEIFEATQSFGFNSEIVTRVAWAMACSPGNTTAGRLIRELGAEAAFTTVVDSHNTDFEGIQELRQQLIPVKGAHVARVLEANQRHNLEVLTPAHSNWPHQLNDLVDATPFILWAQGETRLLVSNPMTSMIGTRVPTGYGEHMTRDIVPGLVERGHTLVATAGYGIDAMVHRSTLASGGNTIAILAGGLDRYYPSGHEALLTRIAKEGLIVSEMPPGAAQTRERFMQRARLIAALAQRTIVVESGYRGGSLHTVGHAIALGRPVGAVPGPVTSIASAGTHRLIRDSQAVLVTSAGDVAALQPAGRVATTDPTRDYKLMLEAAKTVESDASTTKVRRATPITSPAVPSATIVLPVTK